tara:strand:+ start:112 stop:405 length:294 start_codon:yes stop_codon:yes gene_type:complete
MHKYYLHTYTIVEAGNAYVQHDIHTEQELIEIDEKITGGTAEELEDIIQDSDNLLQHMGFEPTEVDGLYESRTGTNAELGIIKPLTIEEYKVLFKYI